ncbi:MAG: hypothetical protein ACR2NQ_00555 [Thermodesulfobacteriota bacterium]
MERKTSKAGTYLLWLAIGLSAVVALYLRYEFIDYDQSGDVRDILRHWYNYLAAYGGIAYLTSNASNYTPVYPALMVLSALVSDSAVIVIKLAPVVFDLIAAFFVYKIVRLKYPPPHGVVPVCASVVFLLWPTVLLNASYWGQSDVIYTTGLLAFLYFFLVGRERLAFVAFGFALATKPQAIFLCPLLLLLLLKRRVSWHSFFILPAIYLAVITPVWLFGRPLDELLLIYASHVGNKGKILTWNAPNLYQWVSNTHYYVLFPLGILWTATVVGVLAVAAYFSRVKLDNHSIVLLALFCAVCMPYFLPQMHERYFFVADALAVVFAFYFPRRAYLSVAIVVASLATYDLYLTGAPPFISLSQAAFLLGAVVLVLGWMVYVQLFPKPPTEPIKSGAQTGPRKTSARV